ncbi:MAG: serine hydrolase [Hyphomonadaceae bacterium]|nr:serine hydrolase [Hyphomonadaceae bacterium]
MNGRLYDFIALFLASGMLTGLVGCANYGSGGGQVPDSSHYASGVNAANRARTDVLDALLEGRPGLSPELSGLQLAVMKQGEVIFSYAKDRVGSHNESTFPPFESRSKVRVASISKLAVSIGIMRLVERGQIDLDADVSQYLGFELENPNFPSEAITVRQLLSHTSSIRDSGHYWLTVGETFTDFFVAGGRYYDNARHFADGEGQQPGAFFTYSNLNFGIAAGIIERVSGQRFDTYMEETVFRPLGLKVGFSPCSITRIAPDLLAPTYRRNNEQGEWIPDGPWRAQVDGRTIACHVGMAPFDREQSPPDRYLDNYVPADNPTFFSPQGGLRASAEDLAVLMKLMLGKGRVGDVQVLRPETVEDMLMPVWTYDAEAINGITDEVEIPGSPNAGLMTSYGLSVHLIDLQAWGLSENRRVLAGHLGEAYGLLGQFWFDPRTGDGFIALITGTGDDPASFAPGSSPLYYVQEEMLRWWLENF